MINDHLSSSDEVIEYLKACEKLRLLPYNDQTGEAITKWCKGATIGYGHLITKENWTLFKGEKITLDFAEKLLTNDLIPIEDCIHSTILVPLQQHKFDALAMLCFNIGTTQFRQSSLVRLLNDPQAVTTFASTEAAWKAFHLSQGRSMPGLVKRRELEWRLFSEGIYAVQIT